MSTSNKTHGIDHGGQAVFPSHRFSHKGTPSRASRPCTPTPRPPALDLTFGDDSLAPTFKKSPPVFAHYYSQEYELDIESDGADSDSEISLRMQDFVINNDLEKLVSDMTAELSQAQKELTGLFQDTDNISNGHTSVYGHIDYDRAYRDDQEGILKATYLFDLDMAHYVLLKQAAVGHNGLLNTELGSGATNKLDDARVIVTLNGAEDASNGRTAVTLNGLVFGTYKIVRAFRIQGLPLGVFDWPTYLVPFSG